MPDLRLSLAISLLGVSPCLAQGGSVAPIDSTKLLEAISGDDDKALERAFNQVKKLGPRAAPLVPGLIELLDTRKGFAAAHVLGLIGKPAVAALCVSLESGNGDRRTQAAHALSKVGPAAEPALPTLLKLARTEIHWNCRIYALKALGGIGKRPEVVLPMLKATLSHSQVRYVIAAHEALGGFKPKGLKVREAWQRRALDKTQSTASVRALAAALAFKTGWTKDEHVREGLVDAIRKGGVQMRVLEEVMEVLRGGGPASRWALPFLIDALRDPERRVRKGAAHALAVVSRGAPQAGAVITALTKALDDDVGIVRMTAAYALYDLAAPKHPATEAKLTSLAKSDPEPYVRKAARVVLEAFAKARKRKAN